MIAENHSARNEGQVVVVEIPIKELCEPFVHDVDMHRGLETGR